MAILSENEKRDINKENIGELKHSQKILSNRHVMIKNLTKLIENLDDCEEYIQNVVEKKEVGDPDIGRMLNKCMGQFTQQDMRILETLVNSNFKNAMMTNSLSKLQSA
jgi:hypothetical protein